MTALVADIPEEPACVVRKDSEGGVASGHDWRKTGVRGYAGGICISERCPRCRRTKVTNTWAQEKRASITYLDPEAS